MAQLDLFLGPILVGTIISVFLAGTMLIQCYNYFVQFPRDNKWIKIMVIYLFIAYMTLAGIESAIAYQYTISFYDNLEKITLATSLFASIPFFSGAISGVAQCFFAWRIARLTRRRSLGLIIGVLALTQFC
jgi:hypothetical protein